MAVVLETTLGNITVDLYLDERPQCAFNFLKLCAIKYYNLSLFHKVQRNFIAQCGKPYKSTYANEPNGISIYYFQNSQKYFPVEKSPTIKHKKLGTLSMISDGAGFLGSQFFLTLATNIDFLDNVHCVFGEVTEGLDVLQKFNDVICDPRSSQPYQDVRILHTVVLHDPFENPKWISETLASTAAASSPDYSNVTSEMIGFDELVDETCELSEEEVKELNEEREEKARAHVLTMIGDLPYADVRPPENVLFVCRLNPVTNDDDLKIIFNRFGPIRSCEIVRDSKTNNSLCYGFIDFENKEDCENAYFKMDNVLIDDRRIHVDFCQSVARLRPTTTKSRRRRDTHEKSTSPSKEPARENRRPPPHQRKHRRSRETSSSDRSSRHSSRRFTVERNPHRKHKRKSRSRERHHAHSRRH